MPFLEIAVHVPQASGVFHYHLPPELEGRVQPGSLVTVPFSAQTVQGVVLRPVDVPDVPQTKPVLALLDPAAVLTPAQIALARQLAADTLAPLASLIGLILPAGIAQLADTLFTQTSEFPQEPGNLTPLQQRLLTLLAQRGPLRGRQIDRAIPRANWRASMGSLIKKGLISSQSVLPPPAVHPKNIRTAQIAVPPAQAQAALPGLSRVESVRERRAKILHFLQHEAIPVNVSWVYAHSGGSLADLKALAEHGLIILRETEIWRDPLAGVEVADAETPPQLTRDQQTVWDEIAKGIAAAPGNETAPYLLHGVTGSGKTEIYLQAVEAVIARGRQAIVLVPEIALTPQTVRRFMARFPGRVGLLHSQLSPGEQYDTWRRARGGELSVIVGPRSALFAPLPDIGLIVLDECHDPSYYQPEPPFYHARDAAAAYARLLGAVCLLGSATPDVESHYRAQAGQWRLLALRERILSEGESGALPPVRIVDMRQEFKAGNRSIFSRALQETLGATLHQNQQAILFLNRRGTATYVFCRDCGHTLRCPRCDEVALTWHRAGEALRCHHCGYTRQLPKKCPHCGGERIRQYGTGTERVEEEVRLLFPRARTLRWDWETTRKKGAHDLILSHFANHQADVLIGTQMLAKGLHLPLVTLVGIVLADVGLHLPDFRAGERAFQTLTQVAGRAGRSALGGEVILQTFDPHHYVIQAAAGHDYENFQQDELKYRREIGYPPFGKLVRLEHRDTDAARAEQAAQRLARRLEGIIRAQSRTQTELIGPAPCFFSRLDGYYRWQIILRGPDPASLLAGLKLADWRVETNPQSLL
jgi:primosomal protein N' (replication factor Y)